MARRISIVLATIFATISLPVAAQDTLGTSDWPIPAGYEIVHDQRSYSCAGLTPDEQREVDNYENEMKQPIEFLHGRGAPDGSKSCLMRDEAGRPALMNRQFVVPGSWLLLYNEKRDTSELIDWRDVEFAGLKLFSDNKGSAIELPIVELNIDHRGWRGDASQDPKGRAAELISKISVSE